MQILMAPHFQMFVAIKCLMKFELHLFFTEFKYIYVFPQYNTVNKREETAKSYSFIDPEDYRATALINKVSQNNQHILSDSLKIHLRQTLQGKHLLNANIVQKLDAILALKVIGDDCGTVTWICDAKHGEGSVKMLTSKNDQGQNQIKDYLNISITNLSTNISITIHHFFSPY